EPREVEPADVALTDQDLAAESSTSAVTVQVVKRSTSGPDTAGASGSGLAPPPGAARSILQIRLGGLPAEDCHPRAAADHQDLVERSREGRAIPAACPNHVQIDSNICIPPVGPLRRSGPTGR